MKPLKFNEEDVHRHYSAHCFNKAWDLLELAERTPEQDRELVLLNQASLWHWLQRPDCTDENLSVGYWQSSRIHALLGNGELARRDAELSQKFAVSCEPFYQAYAVEALARSELCRGNLAAAHQHREQARLMAQSIANEKHRKMLLDDLITIG
jgi:hypothetical protein